MENLIHDRLRRLKLLKYIFLSAGCCVLFAIILTLHLKNASDQEAEEALKKQSKNALSKNYSLSINKPIFEGVTDNLEPYRILAQTVDKNLENQYTLHEVNANCKINNTIINAKATNAILDDTSKLVTLKQNVQITSDDTVLKCEELKINLETQEAKSNSNIELDFKKSNIKADSLTLQRDKGTATFSGSVIIHFDNFTLKTSELVAFFKNDKSTDPEIQKIVIPGKLKAIHNCKTEIVTADRGVYDNFTKKLTLLGNVHVQKEDNILITDKMVYSTALVEKSSHEK
jgi:lipopolysaccharide transport protein LptA